jgi:hypothetical protein
MGKLILIAAVVGLIVGLGAGILLATVPAIGNLVPDGWESAIIGGLAGGAAVLAVAKLKKN